MPIFEKSYKKTPREIKAEEMADKDQYGETPDEIQKNVQAVMEKYDREANVRIYRGVTRRIVRLLFIFFSL